jgi:hypothetical protein
MLRQKAIASAGAVQAAIMGADVDTAATAMTNSAASRPPGTRMAESVTPPW